MIQNDLGARITAMQAELSGLRQAETAEITNTLQAHQQQHIQKHLAYNAIRTASIPGVGGTFKARLIASGFTTAADVSFYAVQRVQGIGNSRATAIQAWRNAIEANARRTMPAALEPSELNGIRSKYTARQLQLERDIATHEQRRRAEEAAARARSQADRVPIDKERTDIQQRRRQDVGAVNGRYLPQYAAVRQQSAKLAADFQKTVVEADRRIQQLTAELGPIYFQREKLRRERGSVSHINFSNYFKRVVIGWKPG